MYCLHDSEGDEVLNKRKALARHRGTMGHGKHQAAWRGCPYVSSPAFAAYLGVCYEQNAVREFGDVVLNDGLGGGGGGGSEEDAAEGGGGEG